MILDEKRDTAETAGGVENNSGLSPTDNVSIDIISENSSEVNKNSSDNESHSVSAPINEETKANNRKKYADALKKRYGGEIDSTKLKIILGE